MKNSDNDIVKKWDTYDEVGIGVGSYTDIDLFNVYNKGRVLDMGCGRGKFVSSLPNVERYGVDMSERAIKTAQNNYPNITFQVASVTNLPFVEDFFDFTYSLEVIEHVEDYEKMISEMVRVTKQGGYIFIQTPNYPIKRVYDFVYWLAGRRSIFDDYTHVSKFPFFTLRKSVEKYAHVVEIKTRNIIFENRFSFLKTLRQKGNILSLWIGQKTIVVAQKPLR